MSEKFGPPGISINFIEHSLDWHQNRLDQNAQKRRMVKETKRQAIIEAMAKNPKKSKEVMSSHSMEQLVDSSCLHKILCNAEFTLEEEEIWRRKNNLPKYKKGPKTPFSDTEKLEQLANSIENKIRKSGIKEVLKDVLIILKK